MTETETVKVLKVCKQIWPKYYEGKTAEFHRQIIERWMKEFDRAPFEHVKNAIYELAGSQRVHPTEKEVKEKILSLYDSITYSFGSERPTPEAWAKLKNLYQKAGMEWPEETKGSEYECS